MKNRHRILILAGQSFIDASGRKFIRLGRGGIGRFPRSKIEKIVNLIFCMNENDLDLIEHQSEIIRRGRDWWL